MDRAPIRRSHLGGLNDEAGGSIQEQIASHLSLGWSSLELRSVDGVPIGRLGERELAETVEALQEAGLSVSVLDSRIGNWESSIGGSFSVDLEELEALLGSADRLGTRFIRVMSYPNDAWEEEDWRREVRYRIVRLSERAADRGVVLLHENCHGWAAHDPDRALALIEATGGRGLALLFDIGNPVAHGYDGPFYLERVLPHVAHFHVKDALPAEAGNPVRFVFPGEGSAQILRCLDLALAEGYQGGISIEPHIAALPHRRLRGAPPALRETFLDYGCRFMGLLGMRLERAEEPS